MIQSKPPVTGMRVFTRSDVERLLDMRSCIEAVGAAFRSRAAGEWAPSGVLGMPLPDGGFHVKAAAMRIGGRAYFAAKVNANFPGNPARLGLPTIQGMLALFDAESGAPLALMDSMSLTAIRTAAASAVAATWLASPQASVLAIVGCGAQARPHVAAINSVRPVTEVRAFDRDPGVLAQFLDDVSHEHGVHAVAASNVVDATRSADIVVTCTPSRAPILGVNQVRPGAFVAAVGADHEHKHEVAPALLASAAIIVDDLDQCAAMGDLHHAIDAGVVTRASVRATLGDVIVDPARGRHGADEIVVFDSTGVGIQDVAAAVVVLDHAETENDASTITFGA